MARLLVIVLALLLPLQFSWGAVLGYCQHETAPAQTSHVGHHAHEHKAQAAKPDHADKAKPAGVKADADCGDCHASSLTGVPVPGLMAATAPQREAVAPALPHRYPSAPQRAPDRPQWPRLVA